MNKFLERLLRPRYRDIDGDGLVNEEDPNRGNPDIDGDGLNDGDEVEAGTNYFLADTDGDGLDDGDEVEAGTNPLVADTDGDGLNDGDEVLVAGSNPLVADTDGDGLDDGDEVLVAGSNPLQVDTDGDGVGDGDEVSRGTDPTAVTSGIPFVGRIIDSTHRARIYNDADGETKLIVIDEMVLDDQGTDDTSDDVVRSWNLGQRWIAEPDEIAEFLRSTDPQFAPQPETEPPAADETGGANDQDIWEHQPNNLFAPIMNTDTLAADILRAGSPAGRPPPGAKDIYVNRATGEVVIGRENLPEGATVVEDGSIVAVEESRAMDAVGTPMGAENPLRHGAIHDPGKQLDFDGTGSGEPPPTIDDPAKTGHAGSSERETDSPVDIDGDGDDALSTPKGIDLGDRAMGRAHPLDPTNGGAPTANPAASLDPTGGRGGTADLGGRTAPGASGAAGPGAGNETPVGQRTTAPLDPGLIPPTTPAPAGGGDAGSSTAGGDDKAAGAVGAAAGGGSSGDAGAGAGSTPTGTVTIDYDGVVISDEPPTAETSEDPLGDDRPPPGEGDEYDETVGADETTTDPDEIDQSTGGGAAPGDTPSDPPDEGGRSYGTVDPDGLVLGPDREETDPVEGSYGGPGAIQDPVSTGPVLDNNPYAPGEDEETPPEPSPTTNTPPPPGFGQVAMSESDLAHAGSRPGYSVDRTDLAPVTDDYAPILDEPPAGRGSVEDTTITTPTTNTPHVSPTYAAAEQTYTVAEPTTPTPTYAAAAQQTYTVAEPTTPTPTYAAAAQQTYTVAEPTTPTPTYAAAAQQTYTVAEPEPLTARAGDATAQMPLQTDGSPEPMVDLPDAPTSPRLSAALRDPITIDRAGATSEPVDLEVAAVLRDRVTVASRVDAAVEPNDASAPFPHPEGASWAEVAPDRDLDLIGRSGATPDDAGSPREPEGADRVPLFGTGVVREQPADYSPDDFGISPEREPPHPAIVGDHDGLLDELPVGGAADHVELTLAAELSLDDPDAFGPADDTPPQAEDTPVQENADTDAVDLAD